MHIVLATFLTYDKKKQLKRGKNLKREYFRTLLGSSSVRIIKGSEMMPSDARKITSDKLITGSHDR